jgi:hypothetical protein
MAGCNDYNCFYYCGYNKYIKDWSVKMDGIVLAFSDILQIALAVVGITEASKVVYKLKDNRWYLLVMVLLGAGFSFVFYNTPKWIFQSILVFATSQLFYDIILKTFKGLIDKVSGGRNG